MKRKLTLNLLIVFIIFSFSPFALSQPAERLVKVVVAPDHVNWKYETGENVKFNISVLRFSNPVRNVKIKYELRPEKMVPVKTEELILKSGKTTIDGGTLRTPGFLRCWVHARVEGTNYTGYATAGFDVTKIKPTTTLPDDFKAFWQKAKEEAAKIPIDAKVTLLPDRCTETVNVYHVSIQNYQRNSKIYGILAKPKTDGKYPALLRVPGAGVRAYGGQIALAEKGIITFEIGIHGIPVTMQPNIYNDLRQSALRGYWFYNLDDRNRYYYKRVYLGCVRAIDFIFALPQFDGTNLAVFGGSQGGALSIITASLDNRVKWLGAYYPALCDLTGYLNNRAGGWPHMFAPQNADFNVKKDKIETSKYYDVVNFARNVKVPGFYSWGFNDLTCPPTSMFAAYNVITAPKQLLLMLDTGHWTYPEQREKMEQWLVAKLSGSKE